MKFDEAYHNVMQKLLFEDVGSTIALLPGGFKPPHKGHFEVLKDMIGQSNADYAVVFIGKGERDGITAEQSKEIWEIYQSHIDIPVKINIAPKTPVLSVYEFVDDNLGSKIFVGAGKEDQKRYAYFDKHPEKYSNVAVLAIEPKFDRISGTETRKNLSDVNWIPEIAVQDAKTIHSILGV